VGGQTKKGGWEDTGGETVGRLGNWGNENACKAKPGNRAAIKKTGGKNEVQVFGPAPGGVRISRPLDERGKFGSLTNSGKLRCGVKKKGEIRKKKNNLFWRKD